MKNLSPLEKIVYALLLLLLLIGLAIGLNDTSYFDLQFAPEDGVIENLTALVLFAVGLLCLYRLFTLFRFKPVLWKLGTLLFALLFLFAAGEEISWGQRIFNVSSSEFFAENNAQGETNLHNLVVGETKINKLIFSQLLMIVMLLYLLLLPVLYRKWSVAKKLTTALAVPVVKWHQTLVFIVVTLLVLLNPADKKWEVYELAFAAVFLLIFLYPLNKHIFEKK